MDDSARVAESACVVESACVALPIWSSQSWSEHRDREQAAVYGTHAKRPAFKAELSAHKGNVFTAEGVSGRDGEEEEYSYYSDDDTAVASAQVQGVPDQGCS